MKTFKRSLIYALIGIGIGTLIQYLFVIIIGKGFSPAVPAFIVQFNSETAAVGTQLFIFAMLGMIQGNASALFSAIDTKKGLLLAGYYSQWFQLRLYSLLGMLLFISLIYAIIYLFNYLSMSKVIRHINANLQ